MKLLLLALLLAADVHSLRLHGAAPRLSARASVNMALPAEAKTLLPEASLSNSETMDKIDKLWDKMVSLYKSEDAAMQAVKQTQIVLSPIFVSPDLMQDSYDGLLSAMGSEADAMEILKKHPAVLTCGPEIANETPDEIRKVAALRSVLDAIPPSALWAASLLLVVLTVYRIYSVKTGMVVL
tara:strand:+ start:4010 stop:4555 length:546 start_codon:yes stop_codon:yes gene_type:complete